MTRKASRVRDRRRPEILERLSAAVEALLAEGLSYTELSVDRITAAADLPRSTFYLYFSDKGELLEALAGDLVEGLLEPVRAWIDLPDDAVRDDVYKIHVKLLDRLTDHAPMLRAVVDVTAYDARIAELWRGLVYQAVDLIADHIKRGQKAGSVRPNVNGRVTAEWLCWMTERGLYQLVPGTTRKRRNELADALTTILWSTLYEGAPTRTT